jgi:hypothetical protein
MPCGDSTGVIATADLRRLQLRHWALVLLSAALFVAVGAPGAGGVLAGGAAIGLSVLLYALGLRAVLRRGHPRLAIGLLSVKLLAFLGLGWLVFTSGREHRPDPIGFAVGITCFPAAAVWEAMRVRGS